MISQTKRIFNKLFIFSAKLIYIPVSHNRPGIDPFPRFFVQPEKLKEVLNYSKNASSKNAGYKKDNKTGLYVKNIDLIDLDQLTVQFDWLSMQVPYGYYDEDTYAAYVEHNFNPRNSEILKAKFLGGVAASGKPAIKVSDSENSNIPVQHYYVEIEDWITQEFSTSRIVNYAKYNRVKIF
tara:strand:- start:107 stop:646 length:540 start_codon:yes stop_codon:yes gene_type:complete